MLVMKRVTEQNQKMEIFGQKRCLGPFLKIVSVHKVDLLNQPWNHNLSDFVES